MAPTFIIIPCLFGPPSKRDEPRSQNNAMILYSFEMASLLKSITVLPMRYWRLLCEQSPLSLCRSLCSSRIRIYLLLQLS